MKSLFCLILFFVSGLSTNLYAQISVQNANNPTEVLNELAGAGVIISNIEITGQQEAYGTYKKTAGSLPLDKGVLITTGLAKNAQGSNNSASKSKIWGAAGDADLDNIVDMPTRDACVVAFDIKPTGSKLTFRYTFGSEEYLEYVNQGFNDVFAFLISGQNPAGGLYDKRNLALIPNTNVPVTIKNINDNENSDYFQDNTSSTSPYRTQIQYDGFTKGLFVEVDVVPCATYRLELKIADVQDDEIDSGVFIEKINSPLPTFDANITADYGGLLEGCAQREIKIKRVLNDKIESMRLNADGEAKLLEDYTLLYQGVSVLQLPFDFSMGVGISEKVFTLIPKADAVQESPEKLNFYLEYGCSFEKIGQVSTKIIDVSEFKPISTASGENSTRYVCGGTGSITLESFSGKSYQWTSQDGTFTCLDADCKKIQTAPLLVPATYSLSLSIENCNFSQNITIVPIPQDKQVEKKEFCPAEPATFIVYTPAEEDILKNEGRTLRYEWSRTQGVTNNQLTVKSAKEEGIYVCKVYDQISGCVLREKTFDMTITCKPIFEIPTGFTPNGDGLNDNVKVFLTQVSGFELRFFNKWGECVHIARNANEAWNGKIGNSPAPAGMYIWQASYSTPLSPDVKLSKKGSIILIR